MEEKEDQEKAVGTNEEKLEPPQKEKPFTSVRWWENYVVRYFVGSVVGSAIILFLLDPSLEILKQSIFHSDSKNVEAKDLNVLMLAALGLAYCYFASAPMLTIHATRAQLGLVEMNPRWRRRGFIICTVAAFAISLKYLFRVEWRTMACLELLLFSLVVGVQAALLVEAHWQKFKLIQEFYRNLSTQRAKAENDRVAKEYVESYRHLREHGNAYAIIVLELILALALASVSTSWQKVLILFLWVAPAGYCWLIPTLLEARFAQSQK